MQKMMVGRIWDYGDVPRKHAAADHVPGQPIPDWCVAHWYANEAAFYVFEGTPDNISRLMSQGDSGCEIAVIQLDKLNLSVNAAWRYLHRLPVDHPEPGYVEYWKARGA